MELEEEACQVKVTTCISNTHIRYGFAVKGRANENILVSSVQMLGCVSGVFCAKLSRQKHRNLARLERNLSY